MTGWILSEFADVPSPDGYWSELAVVEVEAAAVGRSGCLRARRGSQRRATLDCSFGPICGRLRFSAWDLVHAAKKTELASPFQSSFARRKAGAFWLEHHDSFAWNTSDFRRVPSRGFSLEDFAAAGLAGRIGEAVAYLLMAKRGFKYWDRCASLQLRAIGAQLGGHPESVRWATLAGALPRSRLLQPDFVMEKEDGEVALMESKGSFASPSKAKGDLKHALEQLEGWRNLLRPAPDAKFAIGTYVREEGETGDDPSLVLVVDPPGEDQGDPSGPVELTPGLLRRSHYSACLIGMGLIAPGLALVHSPRPPAARYSLPVIQIERRRYAVTPHAAICRRQQWPQVDAERQGEGSGVVVMGLDVNVMRQIEANSGGHDAASVLIRAPEFPLRAAVEERGPWSVLPDGAFMGRVGDELLAGAEFEDFIL